MGRVKCYLSELSPIFLILAWVVLLSLISCFGSHFFGNTYEKYYTNNESSVYALAEFQRVCEGYDIINDDRYEIEYMLYYDDRNKAIGDFMSIAHALNKIGRASCRERVYLIV